MNQRETIEGITGEWRTVTKASEVTVGQRVRYTFRNDNEKSFDVIHDYDSDTTNIDSVFNTLFRSNVQAFFPLPNKQKRKVAKIYIEPYRGCITSPFTLRVSFSCWNVWVDHYCSRKSALRGARRFCDAIGYEMEVVK
jgi:hypothetical protein